MSRFVKFLVGLLLVVVASVALAADITRYSYVTRKVKQADGTTVVQRWQYTYVNNKLRAKTVVSETVLGAKAPVITYNNVTDRKTQADGSVIETVTRLTYTDGKLTARNVVSSTMVVPPTPVPVIRYAFVTRTVAQADGSVVAEKWKYTYTDEKLTDKNIDSTTVVTPAPAPEPVAVVEPAPVVAEPVIRYAYVTRTATLADGSVVSQRWQYTYVDEKLTAKEIVSTTVISGPTTTTTETTTAPGTPTTVDANFNASTYYNNPNMGTPTPMPSHDPAYYLTGEAGKTISAIGANYAYARGWTGKGSTILVMDTGIDIDGSEFAGKIKYTVDYTTTGIQDVVGHGSQVAAIAAGARDSKGMYGVAFDANLAVAKIGNTSSVSMSSALKALQWAQQYSDIVVANLSSNTNYSTDYKSSVYRLGDGTFYSNHVYYGGTNYYNLAKPTDWAGVLGKEMVLVVAAGNQGLQYTQSPAVFATATDAGGNLLLNGQMLIAGGWNSTSKTPEGNGAGHVCKVVVDSVCKDQYRTSDFFIMAPSVAIETVDYNGLYRTSSGTSFAAPAVSGAAAIVHQLWPYMKGNQIVQLLLKTANKNLPNYDVNVMGQGLLDLNRATQPVGDLGISVTGRTGTTAPLSGSLSVSGGVDATVSSVLSSVSAVDSFQRDFTVDLSPAVASSSQPLHYLKHAPGQSWSSRFAGSVMTNNGLSVSGSGANISVGVSSQAFDPNYQPVQYQVTVTQTDRNPWVNFSGMWGQNTGSTTAEFNVMYSPERTGSWAQAGVMNTVGQYNYAMVTHVSPVRSVYAMAGWRDQNINLYGGIRPAVVSGSVALTVPTSVDASGVMHYSSVNSKIRNSNLAFVGASYDYVKRNHSLNFSATYGQDGAGQIGLLYKLAL